MHKTLTTALKNNKRLLIFIVLMFVFRSSLADWNQVPTGLTTTQIGAAPISIDKLEKLAGTEHRVRQNKNGSSLSNFRPVVVPEGHYLALGDNRDNSADSRVIGFVPRNEIVGRTRRVIWSTNYDNYYLPRSERFFQAL